MTDQGTPTPSDELRQVANRRPHLREHLQKFKQIAGEFPMLVEDPEDYETRRPNVIYPVGGAVYCHVYGDLGQKTSITPSSRRYRRMRRSPSRRSNESCCRQAATRSHRMMMPATTT